MPLRCFTSLFLLLALNSPASADELAHPMPASSPETLEAAREARFASWVFDGDEARAAGKISVAARAYANALEVHDDPVIAGRLGVLFVQLKRPADAVDLLLEGIERAFTNVSKEERRSFVEAYEIARAQVTWLNVTISHVGTTVTIDGKPRNRKKYSAFAIFVLPGEHELRASLEGYKDAVVMFTGTPGGETTIKLALVPLPGTSIEPPQDLLRPRTAGVEERTENRRDLEVPPDDEPEKREIHGGVDGGARPEKTRISVEGGPLIVFGVATWAPAVGAVAGVRFRLKEYFSLGLEGRGAWLTSGIEGRQINAMTAGGIASGCLHWRWVYGCAVGHLGVINIRGNETSYNSRSDTFVMPGFGGRVGANFRLGRGFVLGGSFEAMGLNRRTKVVAGQTELVNHPPVMLGTQIVGAWEF